MQIPPASDHAHSPPCSAQTRGDPDGEPWCSRTSVGPGCPARVTWAPGQHAPPETPGLDWGGGNGPNSAASPCSSSSPSSVASWRSAAAPLRHPCRPTRTPSRVAGRLGPQRGSGGQEAQRQRRGAPLARNPHNTHPHAHMHAHIHTPGGGGAPPCTPPCSQPASGRWGRVASKYRLQGLAGARTALPAGPAGPFFAQGRDLESAQLYLVPWLVLGGCKGDLEVHCLVESGGCPRTPSGREDACESRGQAALGSLCLCGSTKFGARAQVTWCTRIWFWGATPRGAQSLL